MKVLNLRCAHDHRFEGWFSSEDDYVAQQAQGVIACPLCDDKAIDRLPSAPRLSTPKRPAQISAPPAAAAGAVQHQQRWQRAIRELIHSTEDVGDRFPEEARRIHYGEARERGIRGQASSSDADALREEGIEVVSLPMPVPLKGTLQ